LLHIIIVVVVVIIIIIIIFIAERNCQAGSIMLPFLWVQDSKLGPLKEFPWKIVVCFCRSQNQQQSTPYKAGLLRKGGGGKI
jgi:hypothetical protein